MTEKNTSGRKEKLLKPLRLFLTSKLTPFRLKYIDLFNVDRFDSVELLHSLLTWAKINTSGTRARVRVPRTSFQNGRGFFKLCSCERLAVLFDSRVVHEIIESIRKRIKQRSC